MRNIKVFFTIMSMILAFFVMGTIPSVAQEDDDDTKHIKSDAEKTTVSAIERVRPSVIKIETQTTGGGNGMGSGVVIKENGFILTNNHVLKDARRVVVEIFNGKKFEASIIGRSPHNDLAVIKINSTGLKVPRWGDSTKLKIGQTAIAIGNPYKFEGSVSQGIISALDRRIPASGIIYKDLIQTDAAINPGNSGGALIDSRGMVIGINTLVYSGQGGHSATGLGFAIPIHRALEISRQLMSKKQYYSPQPWIGVNGLSITREMAEVNMMPVNQGVLVTEIQPVSPAERGGLRKGDIVTNIGDTVIKNVEDFKRVLNDSKPGDDMILKVWREEKVVTITLKVSQRGVSP